MSRRTASSANPKFEIRNPKSFTLIELLVVVAILLPALESARGQARAVACMSNLRQVGVATQSYLYENSDWFPAGGMTGNANLWKVLLSKYLAATAKKLNSPWMGDNWTPVYACPSVPGPTGSYGYHQNDYKIAYHGSQGSNYGIAGYSGAMPVSERLASIQRPLGLVAWVADGEPTSSDSFIYIQWLPEYPVFYRHISTRHRGETNILWVDWHVAPVYPTPRDFFIW